MNLQELRDLAEYHRRMAFNIRLCRNDNKNHFVDAHRHENWADDLEVLVEALEKGQIQILNPTDH